MAWQTPVFDRTAADVAAGADSCYISPAWLDRVEGNTAYLAQRHGLHTSGARNWTALDMLAARDMRRILDDLALVHDVYRLSPEFDVPAFPAITWQDANQIERLQAHVDDVYQRNLLGKNYTGELCTGAEIGVI